MEVVGRAVAVADKHRVEPDMTQLNSFLFKFALTNVDHLFFSDRRLVVDVDADVSLDEDALLLVHRPPVRPSETETRLNGKRNHSNLEMTFFSAGPS